MIDYIHATQSKPNKNTNDDIAGYEGSVFWLLDGATQLVPPDHGLDAAWHVRRLHEEFIRLVRQDSDQPLASLAKTAIATVGDEFMSVTSLGPDAPQELRPFATLLLCRYKGSRLEYLQLCDSTLAVIRDGQMTVVGGDSRLDDLHVLDDAYKILAGGEGFDSAAYKAALRAAYDRVHATINNSASPEPWYAVAQDASVIGHALKGSIALEAGDCVVLMSDGFTRAVDTLSIYKDWPALADALSAKGPRVIIDEVRAAERADAEGLRYQRSSRHDDATVLIARPAM